MVRIAICDDQLGTLTPFEQALSAGLTKAGIQSEIVLYRDGLKLLADIDAQQRFDVVFLDIEMPDIDGIRLGKLLRRRDTDFVLIYLSNLEEHVFATFQNRPFRFLRKKYAQQDLLEMMPSFLEEISGDGGDLVIESFGKVFRLQPEKIYYMESNGKMLRVVLPGKEIEMRYRMDDMEKQLSGHGFIRIHRGILVNCRYIFSIEKDELVLDNRKRLLISRRRIDEVKAAFSAYQMGSIR